MQTDIEEDVEILVIGDNEYSFHRFGMVGPLFERFFEQVAWINPTITTDRTTLRAESIRTFDVVVDYMTTSELTDTQVEGLREHVADGNGYVALHAASALFTNSNSVRAQLEELIGGAFESHPPFCEMTVEIVAPDHPILDGVDDFTIEDEPYELRWDPSVRVLAETSHQEFGHREGEVSVPVVWTKSYGDGRVCYYANGHDDRAIENPNFRTILRGAIAWADGQL